MRNIIARAEVATEHAAAMIGITCKAANNFKSTSFDREGKAVTSTLRDAMPLMKVARAAAKAAVKEERKAVLEQKLATQLAKEAAEKQRGLMKGRGKGIKEKTLRSRTKLRLPS